jgi:hypothetical protein
MVAKLFPIADNLLSSNNKKHWPGQWCLMALWLPISSPMFGHSTQGNLFWKRLFKGFSVVLPLNMLAKYWKGGWECLAIPSPGLNSRALLWTSFHDIRVYALSCLPVRAKVPPSEDEVWIYVARACQGASIRRRGFNNESLNFSPPDCPPRTAGATHRATFIATTLIAACS